MIRASRAEGNALAPPSTPFDHGTGKSFIRIKISGQSIHSRFNDPIVALTPDQALACWLSFASHDILHMDLNLNRPGTLPPIRVRLSRLSLVQQPRWVTTHVPEGQAHLSSDTNSGLLVCDFSSRRPVCRRSLGNRFFRHAFNVEWSSVCRTDI